jgi:iron complex transport system ATP-binding protein
MLTGWRVMQEGRCVAQGRPEEVMNERLLADVFGVQVEMYRSRGGWMSFVFHLGPVAAEVAEYPR